MEIIQNSSGICETTLQHLSYSDEFLYKACAPDTS